MPFIVSSFQSSEIDFATWISIFTLCLAPLIAHIISGLPEIVHLHDRPSWSDRIGIYNPTTIFWRYFAVLDRRVRFRNWSATDMAASNAFFWNGKEWDGSEDRMLQAHAQCVRPPEQTHVGLLSGSAVKTLVITLQGIQALYVLLQPNEMALQISTSTLFQPMALFGLVRLPAAFWLSDEHHYLNDESPRPPETVEKKRAPPKLWSHKTWRGAIIRALALLVLLALDVLCLYDLVPMTNLPHHTATTLALNLFWLVFMAVTSSTMVFFFARGKSTSTVIPCISSPWYKVYTLILYTMMLILIVISVAETKQTPCGVLTTYEKTWDSVLCRDLTAVRRANVTYVATRGDETNQAFEIDDFDGYLMGKIRDQKFRAAKNASSS